MLPVESRRLFDYFKCDLSFIFSQFNLASHQHYVCYVSPLLSGSTEHKDAEDVLSNGCPCDDARLRYEGSG